MFNLRKKIINELDPCQIKGKIQSDFQKKKVPESSEKEDLQISGEQFLTKWYPLFLITSKKKNLKIGLAQTI